MGASKLKITTLGYEHEERIKHIDNKTKNEIEQIYSLADELKILRKALMNLGVNDKDFLGYFNFVEAKVTEGKVKKTEVDSKPAVQVMRNKGGTK